MGKRSIKFNKDSIDSLPQPEKRVDYHADDRSGLTVRVSPKLGADNKPKKTFYLMRRLDGRLERICLGAYPKVSVEAAKKRAADLNGQIARGDNPAQVKRAVRGEATFGEIFKRYLEEKRNRRGHPLSDRTLDEYRKVFKAYLLGLSTKKLSKISREDVRLIHSKIESCGQRNKVKVLIDAVYRWAGEGGEGITDSVSPAKGLKTTFIEPRRRILKEDEIGRFITAVTGLDSEFRDVFLVAAGTGARRSNILSMRWADLDLGRRVWTIPGKDYKNGETTVLPLHRKVVAILRLRRRNRLLGAEYVFPGSGASGHLIDTKRAWGEVLKEARIEGLRLHDIRRSIGSYAAMNGASLRQVGAILGQKSPQASAIYSVIADASKRDVLDGSIESMLKTAARRRV